MLRERALQTSTRNRAGALLRRAIALASMLALTVPVLITTLAEPAGATTFSVPGLVANSAIGHATGITVDDSITLTATGAWTENTNSCGTLSCYRGPNGTGSPLPGEIQSNWLLPNGSAFVLAGRIGTSGPWTAVGSGPTTLNGTGILYMAMNDRLPSYDDNAGSMTVHFADSMQLSTQYLAGGPVLAGTPVDWQGTVENTNGATLGNAQARVSLGAPASGLPTWTNPSSETSGNCTASEGDVYLCAFGDIPPGESAVVEATADTQGLAPQTLDDQFALRSGATGAYDTVAPVAHQQVDGLRFDVLAPDSIAAGNVLSLTGTVTNTSATETITGILVHADIDSGAILSGPPGCTIDNGSEGGGAIDCVSFNLPPGGSVDGTTTVNTNGPAGTAIGWSVYANTPDLGGNTYVEAGSVDVVTDTGAAPPTVSIASPANNATLLQSQDYNFEANASPGAGQTLDFVDLQIDFGPRTIISEPPYATTIESGELSPGPHVLKATAHDTDGQTASASVSVNVAPPATLEIATTTPPIVGAITADGDAAWAVQVTNSSGVAAHDVRLAFDVTATATNSTTTALSFDQGAINGGLNLPSTTPTCAHVGESSTFVCKLPDIPANSSLPSPFRVFVTTNGVTTGSTITGDATAFAANASNVSGALGEVDVVSCGDACVIGVAAPGDPFASSPDAPTPANPTKQVITLSSGTAGGPPQPAVTVELSSIEPEDVTEPGHEFLCPTAPGTTHCPGQISSVVGDFSAYANRRNPIRVTIITRWGASIPSGHILMEKPNGGDPVFLETCVVDAVTREFNTPCVLPEIVHGTAAAGNLTTYNNVMFVKDDIRFARRAADGSLITPPGPPTGVVATAGIGNATVRWTAPTATNGAGINGYNVTVLSGGVVQKTVIFNTALLTQTITGLTGGKTYTFKVAARNIEGAGPASAVSNAVKVIGKPAAPTGVVATAGVAKATLRWTAPANNGGTITGYVVTVYVAGVLKRTTAFNTAALTQPITGLTAGKTYTFKVAAKNVAGIGAASAPSNAVKAT